MKDCLKEQPGWQLGMLVMIERYLEVSSFGEMFTQQKRLKLRGIVSSTVQCHS